MCMTNKVIALRSIRCFSMNYINDSNFYLKNTVVTLGKFDGIHIGHRKLIEEVVKSCELNKVIFTFDIRHLISFLKKEIKFIYTKEEKRKIISNFSIDYMLDYPFTRKTVEMKADVFIAEVLKKRLDSKKIVVGSDFRFGRDREGDVSLLEKKSKEYGYDLVVIEKEKLLGEEVSSTRIRKFIEEGSIEKANCLLGSPYFISGEIVHGNHLGNTIGMPTINQMVPSDKLIPPFGVYASSVEIAGEKYFGITNIGKKPTVSLNEVLGVETMIFDFDMDVYGLNADVSLLGSIRKERKFSSLSELKKQVDKDVLIAKAIFEMYR